MTEENEQLKKKIEEAKQRYRDVIKASHDAKVAIEMLLHICPHEIHKFKTKDRVGKCLICGSILDLCPSSPNHFCKYEESEEDGGELMCIYCGKPAERV